MLISAATGGGAQYIPQMIPPPPSLPTSENYVNVEMSHVFSMRCEEGKMSGLAYMRR